MVGVEGEGEGEGEGEPARAGEAACDAAGERATGEDVASRSSFFLAEADVGYARR